MNVNYGHFHVLFGAPFISSRTHRERWKKHILPRYFSCFPCCCVHCIGYCSVICQKNRSAHDSCECRQPLPPRDTLIYNLFCVTQILFNVRARGAGKSIFMALFIQRSIKSAIITPWSGAFYFIGCRPINLYTHTVELKGDTNFADNKV